MTQSERRTYLIRRLLDENKQYSGMPVPIKEEEQRRLLRSLMNIRQPKKADLDFLNIQDEYLRAETAAKGITDIKELAPIEKDIYLWQGDITALKCGAIVNAANSGMTGCYCPCHGCIDNAIHTFAGIQLRLECAKIMERQGHAEPTGKAKVTEAYNLPCRYVTHTVGPIIDGDVSNEDNELLASCYLSCLTAAEEKGIDSIAFCCISTGEFHFPNRQAAQTAIKTVRQYKETMGSGIEVIFNVFKNTDYEIYREFLGQNK